MAGKKKAAASETESLNVEVMELQQGELIMWLVGRSPLFKNRKHEAIRASLLIPPGRKTQAERAGTLKHDPVKEFRLSPYTLPQADAPTLLAVRGVAIKKSVAEAAVDIPGTRKAQIGRLVQVTDDLLPVYGIPQISLADVRMADIAKTPDVRTRAVLPTWAIPVRFTFIENLVRPLALTRLIGAAGLIQGVGDWRVAKGGGSNGMWRLASANDPEVKHLIATGGRAAQEAAMYDPDPFDAESESLLRVYFSEVRRRELKGWTPWPRLEKELEGGSEAEPQAA